MNEVRRNFTYAYLQGNNALEALDGPFKTLQELGGVEQVKHIERAEKFGYSFHVFRFGNPGLVACCTGENNPDDLDAMRVTRVRLGNIDLDLSLAREVSKALAELPYLVEKR